MSNRRSFVVALEAGDHILAGLIVGRHHVDAVHTLILQQLAHRLRRLVVVPRRRKDVVGTLLACHARPSRIGGDAEHLAASDLGLRCRQHIRERDTGDEINLVLKDQLLGHLFANVGLELIVDVNHFDVEPADLATEMFERKFNTRLLNLAKNRQPPGERIDMADFDRLGRGRCYHQHHRDDRTEEYS